FSRPTRSTLFPYTTLFRSRDGNLAARFGDSVHGVGIDPWICLLQKFIGGSCRLNVRTVIDEVSDGNARREFSHATKMIAVPVGRSEEHTSELQSLAYLVCR